MHYNKLGIIEDLKNQTQDYRISSAAISTYHSPHEFYLNYS